MPPLDTIDPFDAVGAGVGAAPAAPVAPAGGSVAPAGGPAINLPQVPGSVDFGGGNFGLGQGGAPATIDVSTTPRPPQQWLPVPGKDYEAALAPDGSLLTRPLGSIGPGVPSTVTPAKGTPTAAAAPAKVDPFDALGAGVGPIAGSGQGAGSSGQAAGDSGRSLPAGKTSGYLANMGAGTSEAVAGLLGMPVDLVTGIINLVPRGINAVAGTNLPTIEHPVGGSESMQGAAGWIGADPRNVVSGTPGEGLARAAARGAASVALPGGLARGVATGGPGLGQVVLHAMGQGAGAGGAAAGAGGGVVGHAAAASVPPEWAPLADVVGNIVGGVGTAAGLAGATVAGRIGHGAFQRARQVMPIGARGPVIDPATGQPFAGQAPAGYTQGQQTAAGQRIVAASGQTPGELSVAIPAAGTAQMVPGSTPSMGQATGNLGILGLERVQRGLNRAPFTEAEARNSVARVQALQGLAGAEASGEAAGQFVAERLRAIRAANDAIEQAEAGVARRVTEQLGGAPGETSEQELGAAHRAALDALRGPVKAAASRLYQAIDPDGTLALRVDGVRDAARQLLREVNSRMGGQLGPDAEVLNAAAALRDVELFSDLRALDSNISAAQRAIRANPQLGAESPPMRRVNILRDAVDAAMAEGAKADAITAWHGSPHAFTHFDAAKIGTGEGAQAYGHGLYFAEAPGVARGYAQKLSSSGLPEASMFIEFMSDMRFDTSSEHTPLGTAEILGNLEQAPFPVAEWLKKPEAVKLLQEAILGRNEDGTFTSGALRAMSKLEELAPKEKGNLYEVWLGVQPDELLSWDSPMSEQPEVAKRLAAMPEFSNRLDVNDPLINGQHILAGLGTPVEAAAKLRAAGIKGIKYLDGNSRANWQRSRTITEHIAELEEAKRQNPAEHPSKGRYDHDIAVLRKQLDDLGVDRFTHNYVVFDPADIEIAKRNGAVPTRGAQPGVGARLAGEAEAVPGAGTSVFTPSGREIGVRYRLAEAADLVASHDDDLRVNRAYPAELQPRNRSRAASAAQVQSIATKMRPQQLGASADVNSGAPIIGPDGVVESGNGRVLGIRRAYAKDNDSGKGYRAWLTSQGYDVAGMREPILVRERTTPLSPEDRVAFAREAAAPTGLAMSATEQAAVDAERISDDMLSLVRPGDIDSTDNRPFVRAFVHGAIEQAEQGGFFTGDNALSVAGAARIRAALLQRAYGDADLVAALAETGDENIKALGGALQDAAGSFGRLRAGIAQVFEEAQARGRATGTGGGGNGAGAGPARDQGVGPGAGAPGQAAPAAAEGAAGPAAQPAITEPPLEANFTPEARAQLRAANRAYAEYKDTFRRGGVGTVLQSGQGPGGFRLAESSVPKTLFAGGPGGAEAADSLIKATGSPEAAVALLGDYPAFAFRRAAEVDGMIDPKKAAAWLDRNSAALDKLPGLRERFADTAAATRSLEEVSVRGQAAIEAYQDSAARHYLNKAGDAVDPQVAIGRLLSSPTAAEDAKRLIASMRMNQDQAAVDGLKRNLVDYILTKTRSTAEAGTTGEKEIAGAVFQRFIANPQNAAVIEAVLGASGADRLALIGQDLERAARAVNATKIPGSPGTAADALALVEHAGHGLGTIGQVAVGSAMGMMLEGVMHAPSLSGVVGGALLATGNAMRLAGLRTVDDLVMQGLLNPELGRVLVSKAGIIDKPAILRTLLARIAAIGVGSAAAGKEKR